MDLRYRQAAGRLIAPLRVRPVTSVNRELQVYARCCIPAYLTESHWFFVLKLKC
jgi:hypothetical protein